MIDEAAKVQWPRDALMDDPAQTQEMNEIEAAKMAEIGAKIAIKEKLQRVRDIMGDAFTVTPTLDGIRIVPVEEARHGQALNDVEVVKLREVREILGMNAYMALGKQGVQ